MERWGGGDVFITVAMRAAVSGRRQPDGGRGSADVCRLFVAITVKAGTNLPPKTQTSKQNLHVRYRRALLSLTITFA
jgi:hypothetical protein